MKKSPKKQINIQEQKQVYKFMLAAAKEFKEEPDILKMTHSSYGYSLKFFADEKRNDIFILYGCDENGKIRSKQPLYIGNVQEIISFLTDKDNVDSVMQQVCDDTD